ncbi:MAG: GAF domain-containing protein [Armatimonadetes bacterium]|nr:GAF domain-containing protein [Armatimonadota bacterium]
MREGGAVYSWAVVLAALGALALTVSAAAWPPISALVVVCMAAVTASALMVPMPAGGYQTLGPAVAAVSLVLFGGPTAAVAMAVGILLGNGVLHRRPAVITLFNVGQGVLATLASATLAHLVAQEPRRWTDAILGTRLDVPFVLAMVSAAFASVFISATLVSWQVALDRRAPFADVLWGNMPLEAVNTFVLFVLGTIVALVLAGVLPLSGLLITIPVTAVSIALMVYASHRQDADELEVLYAIAAEINHHLSVDGIARTIAAGIDRLMPADIVLVFVRPGRSSEPRVVHYRGPGGMERARQLEPDALAGQTLYTGRPIRLADYERDPRHNPQVEEILGRGAVRSLLVVPIAGGEEAWGAIVLARGARGAFTARHERLIAALAGQAALAIRNAHQFEETRRQVDRLSTLQHLGLQASASLDPDEVCRHVITQAAETLGARYAFLSRFDEQTRELCGQAAHGADEAAFQQLRTRLEGKVTVLQDAVRAFRERRVVISDAPSQDDQTCPSVRALPDARVALTVPLARHNRLIGALTVVRNELRPFTDTDVAALEAVAVQGTVSIDNARLHAATARRLRQMEATVGILRRLVGAPDLRAVFRLIAENARQILGADRCLLVVSEEQGGDVLAEGLSEPLVEALTHQVRASIGRTVVEDPLVIADLGIDPQAAAFRTAARRDGVAGAAFFPLRAGGESVGVLVLLHDRPRAYTADDLRVAELFADMAAVALKNAALLAQSERRRGEEALRNRIVGSVSMSLDLAEIFRTAASELATATGVPYVSIYRAEGSWFRLAAQVGYTGIPAELPVTTGIMGRVGRNGRPEFVPSARDEVDALNGGYHITSKAAAPILLDGTAAGVITVEGTSAHPITLQTYELLVAVAQHLSVAVRNASLYEELRKAHDELQVLFEAARAVSGTLDLRTVLDSLVAVTCRAFGYDSGAVLLVDPDAGDLILEASYGLPDTMIGMRLPPGVGITGWVARTGTPLVVDDVLQDARYYRIDDRTRSELAVPLIAEGKVLGVLDVESARPAAFGQRDLHMLTTLASYAVIAVQNARLFEQARRLAITDGLTELHNHRYLYEALDRMLERARRDGQPLALIMVEIDKFKRFNDTYGHQRGDEVLRTVATLLRRGSRPSDTVARYGGDEFMVVLPGVGKPAAQETAERLRRAVEAYPLILGDEVIATITLSLGVAAFPVDGRTVDALVEAVDRAQYIAKRSGGNKVHAAQGAGA